MIASPSLLGASAAPAALTATRLSLLQRPRRLRQTETLRRMVRETTLHPGDLIYPLFVMEGEGQRAAVTSMPGINRYTIDTLLAEAEAAVKLGIPAIALFPLISEHCKDNTGAASCDPNGLIPRTLRALKQAIPEVVAIADVALDPYSSFGHDGLVDERGCILNDATVAVLVQQALMQAEAGADIVAPSDMMDGRIGAIRNALDAAGYSQVAILAYTAKYASAYYGPFREALESTPKFGDKKTYQMDPANAREASKEASLDVSEGADLIMVKPALAYLDIVARLRQQVSLPIAAYNVSGEYAAIKAAAQQGWLDERAVVLETLTCMKRAGADLILSYFAKQAAQWLQF